MRCSIILLLFLFSCGTKQYQNEHVEIDNSPISKCLKKNFDDYFKKFHLIIDVLHSNGLLVDDQDGFSGAIENLYSPEIGHYNLSESERKELQFIDDMGDLPLLFSCCSEYVLEKNLTENQIEFYKEFDQAASAGAIDNVKISAILEAMSEKEFESNSVRETALIFIAHELIRNHFLR